MNNTPDIQDKLLREHYAHIERCQMPPALRESIMSKAAAARDKRFSLREELWSIVVAIAVSAAMIWVTCKELFSGSPQYDIRNLLQFKVPDFSGMGNVVVIGSLILLLAVCHMLLLRRFYRKQME